MGQEGPNSVVLLIQHDEPSFKYSGTVVSGDEDSRTFRFEGAIDGRAHDISENYGPGKLTIRRVDPYTTASEFHSDDGHYVENARTTLSKDCKVMTRRNHLKSPGVEIAWTEIYDKQ